MRNRVKLLGGVFYLATVEETRSGDAPAKDAVAGADTQQLQPHVRPFDGMTEVDGKWYFETANGKKVYAQLLAHPEVELFAMQGGSMVRLTGLARHAPEYLRPSANTRLATRVRRCSCWRMGSAR